MGNGSTVTVSFLKGDMESSSCLQGGGVNRKTLEREEFRGGTRSSRTRQKSQSVPFGLKGTDSPFNHQGEIEDKGGQKVKGPRRC